MERSVLRVMALLMIVLWASCGDENDPQSAKPKKMTDGQPAFVREGELTFIDQAGKSVVTIDIEIAETEAEQQQGLMNRSFMPNDRGMLFIFNREEPRSFWMKNTIIPLDIIYVNAAGSLVSIAENTQPYSESSIPSKGPALYVIEVNAGFSAQYALKSGYTMQFTRL